MDILFIIHFTFTILFTSIPFWPIEFLKYGVYVPILLATIWIVFNGCPLTNIQNDRFNNEYFSQVLLRYFYPNISKETTVRIIYYILLLVTVIGFNRLYNQN
jgi:hypothetical protein